MSKRYREEASTPEGGSDASLTLALSPVLTSGFYSESLSSSASSRFRHRSTPPLLLRPRPTHDEGVVIQAGMTLVLDRKPSIRQRGIRQHFRAQAAHATDGTTSSALSNAIQEFLGRTDHVMNEWNQIRGGPKRCSFIHIQFRMKRNPQSAPIQSAGFPFIPVVEFQIISIISFWPIRKSRFAN